MSPGLLRQGGHSRVTPTGVRTAATIAPLGCVPLCNPPRNAAALRAPSCSTWPFALVPFPALSCPIGRGVPSSSSLPELWWHSRRELLEHLAAAAAELLHHLPRLHVLLEQAIDVLDRGAAALGDALAAAAVDHRRLAPLQRGHGIDDGHVPAHLRLAGLRVHALDLQARDHAHDLIERSHLAHLPELVLVVVQRELRLAELADHLLGLLAVDVLLGLLDQPEHVAHPEDAAHHARGLEQLELVHALAHACELDRAAGHGGRAERGAAARVAVELAQHDAGDADAAMELLRALHRVLARHGVGDVEDFAGLALGLERDQLRHQLV